MAAAQPYKKYFARSLDVLRRNSAKVLRAEVAPHRSTYTIWSIDPSTDLTDFAVGSDSDIGGLSTCILDKDEQGDGRFWGEMKLGVQREFQGKVRGGYAGMRNKNLTTLFGPQFHDLSLYSHLALTLRPSGEPQTLRHWFINIQTDGPVRSDLFQHRLSFPPTTDGTSWLTLQIPLDSFVLTNSGSLSDTQIPMMRTRIRTIGLSLLGGGREAAPDGDGMGDGDGDGEGGGQEKRARGPLSVPQGVEGRFELGIRRIEGVNRDAEKDSQNDEEYSESEGWGEECSSSAEEETGAGETEAEKVEPGWNSISSSDVKPEQEAGIENSETAASKIWNPSEIRMAVIDFLTPREAMDKAARILRNLKGLLTVDRVTFEDVAKRVYRTCCGIYVQETKLREPMISYMHNVGASMGRATFYASCVRHLRTQNTTLVDNLRSAPIGE